MKANILVFFAMDILEIYIFSILLVEKLMQNTQNFNLLNKLYFCFS